MLRALSVLALMALQVAHGVPASHVPTTTSTSSGTRSASYTTPQRSCSVYANGTGMGSYCATVGRGEARSLRERFSGQVFDRCRYSEVPSTMQVPFNARPDDGRYLLMQCLDHVDFDTVGGGPRRSLSMQVVWVPSGTDTAIRHNGVSDFLWHSVHATASLPVPFLQARPNPTPVVGYPTSFTFRWLDPVTHRVVDQGPYAGKPDGGPFKQIDSRGLILRAIGTHVTLDPRQKGIEAVTCDRGCSITFPRSSAAAGRYAEDPIPADVRDAFYVAVTVTWHVSYGEAGDLHRLGKRFTMRVRQALPVQEVQGADQPPTALY